MKPADDIRPAHERRDATVERIVKRRIKERDRAMKPARKTKPRKARAT